MERLKADRGAYFVYNSHYAERLSLKGDVNARDVVSLLTRVAPVKFHPLKCHKRDCRNKRRHMLLPTKISAFPKL